ncbi:UbiA family prenyltransferase [Patescibacteria group bacterium]|nr:UbiA family prenyltransferase [Patescibacteria group bacterium]
MEFLKKILFISRPRIWIYTVGSFALGVQVGTGNIIHVFSPDLIWLTLWLTLPANLFLYAFNDAYDLETDLHNPKKDEFEHRASFGERKSLLTLAAFALVPAFWIISQFSNAIKALFLLWLLIVVMYNMPPLRFKGRPFWDLFFAVNFPLWGVMGYMATMDKAPPFLILLALFVFAIAMHMYTSIADIRSDKDAGLITSAVFIGSEGRNLLVCIILSFIFSGVLILANQPLLMVLGMAYALFFLIHFMLRKKYTDQVRWYRYFIYLHYVIGFIASLLLVQ